MELKLFDSERKVMEVLWDAAQDLPAREVARRLEQSVGWNKNEQEHHLHRHQEVRGEGGH